MCFDLFYFPLGTTDLQKYADLNPDPNLRPPTLSEYKPTLPENSEGCANGVNELFAAYQFPLRKKG